PAGALRPIVAIEHEGDRFLDERAQARAGAGGGLRQALALPERDGGGLRNRSAHGTSRRSPTKQSDYLKIIPSRTGSSAATARRRTPPRCHARAERQCPARRPSGPSRAAGWSPVAVAGGACYRVLKRLYALRVDTAGEGGVAGEKLACS